MARKTIKSNVNMKELKNLACVCCEQNTPAHVEASGEVLSLEIMDWGRKYVTTSKNTKRDFLVLIALLNNRK